MIWRRFAHFCGHEERVNVDGPWPVVQKRIERVERSLCERCEAKSCKSASEKNGFIELWGSEKQCISAEHIRHLAWRRACVLADHATGLDREAWLEVANMVTRQNDAAWWVEHRSDALQMLAAEIRLTD